MSHLRCHWLSQSDSKLGLLSVRLSPGWQAASSWRSWFRRRPVSLTPQLRLKICGVIWRDNSLLCRPSPASTGARVRGLGGVMFDVAICNVIVTVSMRIQIHFKREICKFDYTSVVYVCMWTTTSMMIWTVVPFTITTFFFDPLYSSSTTLPRMLERSAFVFEADSSSLRVTLAMSIWSCIANSISSPWARLDLGSPNYNCETYANHTKIKVHNS